jgi:hypothetical protein
MPLDSLVDGEERPPMVSVPEYAARR